MKKNFTLDVILFICALVCFVTGVMMDFHMIPSGKETRRPFRLLHIYSGYIMAVGVILHIFWHAGWIKSAVKNFLEKK